MSYPRTATCRKGQHSFVLEGGRVCSRCGIRRPRMPGTPRLIPLRYGEVYCELCTTSIRTGGPVAWWRLGRRLAAYCPDCHQRQHHRDEGGTRVGTVRRRG